MNMYSTLWRVLPAHHANMLCHRYARLKLQLATAKVSIGMTAHAGLSTFGFIKDYWHTIAIDVMHDSLQIDGDGRTNPMWDDLGIRPLTPTGLRIMATLGLLHYAFTCYFLCELHGHSIVSYGGDPEHGSEELYCERCDWSSTAQF